MYKRQGLECTQTHPPRNQHQKGPICFWVVEEVTESRMRAQQVSKGHCSLSDPSPTYSTTTQQGGLPHPDEYPTLHPLQCNQCAETEKYGPNERTDQNSRKRSDEEIANLPDAEFKTLIIRMLTDMVEYGRKIEKKVKAMKSEIDENVQ